MKQRVLQVKDLIEKTGLDRETLRFYEKEGLLPKAMRSASGYRQFPVETITRIEFIKLAKAVGFSLKEIVQILNLGKHKKLTRQELKEIAQEKIKGIEAKIDSLNRMRQTLQDFSTRTTSKNSASNCPILSVFDISQE